MVRKSHWCRQIFSRLHLSRHEVWAIEEGMKLGIAM
jgi:hypothetical protein